MHGRTGRFPIPAALAWVLASAAAATAQTPAAADPADVATLDGIMAAFYDVVSGPPGQPRQWERDATLYRPGTVFTIADSTGAYRNVTPVEFAEKSDAFLVESGFVEREIHRETRLFGSIAQVWSTYAWETAGGETGRGINGLHLVHDDERWWITHATWDNETAERPIPEEYLPDE
ncbi:MAG: hypothetical protein ACRELU_14080 [Gemmatimonadota bacterium]